MGRAKFEAIMRFFHFGEHPLLPDDRLGKVRLLTEHLNQGMKTIYTTVKNLSSDESMMLWQVTLLRTYQ